MSTNISRRNFVKTAAGGAAALAAGKQAAAAPKNGMPRYRGFNLTDFFQAFSPSRSDGVISEDDCRFIRDWGFDFVRLPMDYWMWIDTDWPRTKTLQPDDVYKIKESTLEQVDRAIETVNKHGLHMSLNFHRAPGYCINNPEREPFVLWSDKRAEDAFVHHWDLFARRYKGISTAKLSFNLVNEAPRPREGYMSREDYVRVMRRTTNKIRESNPPDRLIIIDGLSVGNIVVDEMIPDGVGQSVHAYTPAAISHYRASWVDRNADFVYPGWPMTDKNGREWSRQSMVDHYKPWGELARKGIGVHCGEAGCYNKTPHEVFLAWFGDIMEILAGHGIGWALWNMRGTFGVLDSGRADVDYEKYHGHELDRKLLTVLQRY